ncbi:restriction endonuclease subunit S [Nostoc parmelioides]|uniref:Restriction endonuclease subunit S n=1 Tax=Nostoc parmelioides FACHB-3921 TaxID=2692909 RepID=A0ABR8BK94_9NOSO|nr:restriction endonuclease subunit S [Nostoc parmelioides]MBD2254164.1 restriction endonuclease subunit S [Nostoc parmelioides FACHB-3921]
MREVLVKNEEFKDSPLGIIPKDWDVVSIDEIAVHVGSGITPRGGSNVYTKEGILFIRSQNVTFSGLLLDEVAYINLRTHESMKRSEIFAHDVLINITGASIGRCCPVPQGLGTTNVNQHVCAIRLFNPNRQDAIFLSSVLASHIGQSQIDRLNAGGNREGLNYQQLRSFIIPFPPPEERACIAEILDTVDEAIARTSSLIIKLKQTKAGLLQDLLTRGLDEDGKLRDPQAHPEQFKDSPLGKIPKDWQTPTFEEVTVDDAPICYGIVQPGTYVDSGVPVIAIQNLNTDYQNNIHKSAQIIENRYIRSRVIHNDVLISVKGTIGRVGIVPFWFKGNISRDVARIRLKSCALPTYVRQMLLAPSSQKWLEKAVVGTTRAEISIGILKKLRLLLPPKSEQELIADILETHDNCIRTEEAYLNKLKLQKQGLMQDLLTGKVRVKSIK